MPEEIRKITALPVYAALIILIFSLTVTTPSSGADYTVHRDIIYGGCDGCDETLVSLDIYEPQGGDPHPVMVFIHGGAWRIGDKKYDGEKGAYFAENGFVYVTINYRLSPEVIHPAHIQDVARAVAWIYRNIEKYGGDPGRLFVMGHSAGAHLSALIALDQRRLEAEGLEPDILSGVILLDGAGYNIPLLLSGAGWLYQKLYTPAFTEDPEVRRDASPALHVEENESPPPFLIIYAGDRIEAEVQAKFLTERLTDVGGDVTLFHAPEKTHGTVNRELGNEEDEVMAAVHEFLEWVRDSQ